MTSRARSFASPIVWISLVICLVLIASVGYYFTYKTTNQPGATVIGNSATSPALNKLSVRWTPPRKVNGLGVFETTQLEGGSSTPVEVTADYYSMGTVDGGSYSGDDVILAVITNVTGKGYVSLYDAAKYYFLRKGNSLTLLARDSDIAGDSCSSDNCLNSSSFYTNASSTIAGLTYPEEFSYKNVAFKFDGPNDNTHFWNENPNPFFQSYKTVLRAAFTDPSLGKFYSFIPLAATSTLNNDLVITDGLDTAAMFTEAPDGTVRVYSVMPPFYNASTSVPSITWNDGSQNIDKYFYTDQLDCHGIQIAMQVPVNFNSSTLVKAGRTSAGDVIYGPTNPSDSLLERAYVERMSLYGESVRPVPETFMKSHPIFFWKDPLGTWIEFQKKANMAQCVG